ncbi:MAG: alpha-methylacyl-CoA racemase, partial [Myxococcota bacterium]
MSSNAPLAGIRVLDLSRLLPGPMLSLVLADMGADVIKVEAPMGGDWVRFVPPLHGGLSIQFISLNRGKRSIALDLKKPNGVEAFHRMVESADVVIESFRPGVMDRLGVGYEALSAINPRVIYAAISGYGQTGPYRLRAGHDLNYVSLAGAAAMTGEADERSRLIGVQLGDVGGGSLFGAVGILGALFARHSTGKGRFLDISMTEGALPFNVLALADALAGKHPRRGTETLNGKLACYNIYETKDGRQMSVAPLEIKFWSAFCDAVERPDWKARH